MATTQQPLVTLDTFKGDFQTSKLLSRLSDRIIEQHEARVAAGSNTRTAAKQPQGLPYDSQVSMDQLLMHFERCAFQSLRTGENSRQIKAEGYLACTWSDSARDLWSSIQ